MDTALIVALITAFAAIVSPIITAIINNKHQANIRKLELVYEPKLAAYSAICMRLEHSDQMTLDDINEFINLIHRADILSSDEVHCLLTVFLINISSYRLDETDFDISQGFHNLETKTKNKLIEAMRKDLRRYYN